MKNIKIIGACTDLGVDVDGADKGPSTLINNLNYENSIVLNKPNCIKSHDENDLKKNLNEVNLFNKEVFNNVKEAINNGYFPITLGGDHSMAIGSALASQSINKNLGIIWIDAHIDYNTFETTITGNLHGLPLAAINGICPPLTEFTDNFINSKNTVIVGYRAQESNKEAELANIKRMGVTVFDDDYIKQHGIEYTMNKAFEIALNGTNGVHISYDLDVIAEEFAPGVSVPELGGFDLITAYKVKDILINNIDKIKSFDLVEFNPSNDIALIGTNGVHISYDLDVIAEEFAPGVSVPELGGFDLNTAYKARDILINNIDKIKSFDLVEFNPSNDIDNKTLNIALNIINSFLK